MKEAFPKRCFIQWFKEGDVPKDYRGVVAEMKSRGVPVTMKTTDEILVSPLPLTKDDLVVGNFDWTRMATKQLGCTVTPPDYPKCLEYLLHREIWQSTLGEVQDFLKSKERKVNQVFIKPAESAKAFAAIIEPKDKMLDSLIAGIPGVMPGLAKSTPVHCAEVVKMLSEYRAYVVDGEIRQVCHYQGKKDIKLDMTVVEKAVDTLCKSEEGEHLKGCGMDFAVLDKDGKQVTCLIEVNDGFSLGKYEGLSDKDYTDLLVARWAHLMKGGK
eukprot:CAMPEP_0167781138 /NCGR_PEP_ID=MMETSP0111_2-20121227/5761_1 /TAXON_ID=91324 /ORGANISM="Lotharella globosa, Strain CCCM811" /LENGTH=269 /DNA_ID=CAMNT_0007671757 /DNA_START=12 /DNA_END=821 /DNA_ORIENTATION=+